jgi:hypothetical protein
MTENRLAGLLVVPENHTTLEPEMEALCPELTPSLVARVVRTLVREDLPAYRGSTLEAVEPFFGEKPNLVVRGCTATGFLGGRIGNASMVEALGDRTGAAVVSTAEEAQDGIGTAKSTRSGTLRSLLSDLATDAVTSPRAEAADLKCPATTTHHHKAGQSDQQRRNGCWFRRRIELHGQCIELQNGTAIGV